MSDDQPPRASPDPGPDWWPRFGLRAALVWTLQGFLVPLGIYLGIWLIVSAGLSIASGEFFSEDAISKGAVVATGGFFLTGGSIGLSLIFSKGPRWSTLFRFMGFTLAIIAQWKISSLFFDGYFLD